MLSKILYIWLLFLPFSLAANVGQKTISDEFRSITFSKDFESYKNALASVTGVCINKEKIKIIGLPNPVFFTNSKYLSYFKIKYLANLNNIVTEDIAYKWSQRVFNREYETEVVNELYTPYGRIKNEMLVLIRSNRHIADNLLPETLDINCSEVFQVEHYDTSELESIQTLFHATIDKYLKSGVDKIAFANRNGGLEDGFGNTVKDNSSHMRVVSFRNELQALPEGSFYIDIDKCIYNLNFNPLVIDGIQKCF